MKIVVKILGGLVIIVLLAVGALSVFVGYFLSGEKVAEMLLPQVRKALGRDVAIGSIDVSLFHGIEVTDFTVKEMDGKEDFVSVGRCVLRYDLMPLLEKRLVLTEITLDKPVVRIWRDKQGNFNFQTPALRGKKEKGKSAGKTKVPAGAAAPPLAVTLDRVLLRDALFDFRDEKGALPAIQATADINVGIDLSGGMNALRFTGDGRYELKARYQGVEPQLQCTMDFDQERVAINCDVALQEEKATVSALIGNYLQTPDVEVNLASPRLNIDKLPAITKLLGEKEKKGKKKKAERGGGTPSPGNDRKSPPRAIGDKLPAGLFAHGQVDIAEALYQGLAMNDLHFVYRLEKNIFTVDDLTFKTAEGTVAGAFAVDLNDSGPAYEGDLDLKAVQLARLQPIFFPTIREKLFGALTTKLTWAGSGSKWPVIREQLTGKGDFSLAEGRIENSPFFHSIADALGTNELRTLVFNDYSGNLRISRGDVLLTSAMDGRDVDMRADGRIGLDAGLDLPLVLTLSPEMSEKLVGKTSLVRYLADEQGRTTIKLKMAGDLQKPKVTIDSRTLEKKAIEEIGRGLLKNLLEQ